MTDQRVAAEPSTRSPRIGAVVRRIPATLTFIGVLLVVGLVFGGLWRPFENDPLFDVVAYGLPALSEGRWWTPLTGAFFINQPWVYAFTIASFAGMAYLEFRRGSRVALAYFWVGQLFAVFASALALWLLTFVPWSWPWSEQQAAALDVGASGGTMACLAAAVGLLRAPWRVRAWLVLLACVFIAMMFWGRLADLEHLFAVLLILGVDRSLRIQRTTVREQRLIAFIAVLTLGAIQIITLLVPTSGPFGTTEAATGPWFDVALDTVVILLLANGLRRGRRWAWVVAVILASVNVAVGVLLIVIDRLIPWDRFDADIDITVTDFDVTLATSVLWTLLLIYLIWVRRAFAARRRAALGAEPRPTVDDVKEMIRTDGGGTLSWMTTWPGNLYARTTHGIVAYQHRAGVAIVLGDPLGPEEHRAESVREFIAGAERAGLVPCFFSAGDATRRAVPATWQSLVVADDTIVDLPGLEFTGKRWNSVRSAINRAARENVIFRMTRLSEEPWNIRQQLRAISEMWVGDKGLPEMGFTLGTLEEAADPEVRVAIAVSADGDVDGFLSWLPVYGAGGAVRGWTLDLMRRREGGFGPVMEFLIGSSAKLFSEEGADVLSLSGAPLAHEYPADAGLIADLSDKLADTLEPVYGFQSLHRFKEKFHPRYETMYLLYRDETDLTRIGAGLTRAFLPDATLKQFAGAGLELVRGERG